MKSSSKLNIVILFLATCIGLTACGSGSSGSGSGSTPVNPISPYQKLYTFAGGTDGATPNGLIQASDGNLYGTTERGGGTVGGGTVFKITPAGVYTSLYSFTGGTDGAYPYAGLIQARDGNLYGTTYQGGDKKFGTVFQVTPAGAYKSLYSFVGGGGAIYPDGAYPVGGVIQASDGNFYGTTERGGAAGGGTVFKLTLQTMPPVLESPLYSFAGAPKDGETPYSGLIQATDGNLYGTTYFGGIGVGTVFKITPQGVKTILYSFGGGTDGAYPVAGVIQASDGNLYGTTVGNEGKGSGYGTVFKITPQEVKTILYSFTGGADGSSPVGGLVQGTDGNLYGTTYAGGSSGNNGTIFKVTPQGVKTTLYSFAGGNDGASPRATLVQASDGTLYGTTKYGGGNNSGTVFKIVPPLN